MTTTNLIDSTRASAHNIPTSTLKVGGYVTGTSDVRWTAADWARHPGAGHVRINQGLGTFDPLGCDVLDVEDQALNVAQAVQGVKARISHGITWTTIYGSDSVLAAIEHALIAAGPHGWYFGHVDAWLANWDLSQDEAAALLSKKLHGLTVRAVQWASPTSNPNTEMPGSSLTLSQANCDLSVSQPAWHAFVPGEPPA